VRLRDIFRRKGEDEVAVLPEPKRHEADAKRFQSIVSNEWLEGVTNFYLYLRTPEDAEAAAEALRAEGYVGRAAPSADPESDRPWLVRVSRKLAVGEQSMEDAEAFFRQLAERYDGEYDGWEKPVG
jgi:hypothetical protein